MRKVITVFSTDVKLSLEYNVDWSGELAGIPFVVEPYEGRWRARIRRHHLHLVAPRTGATIERAVENLFRAASRLLPGIPEPKPGCMRRELVRGPDGVYALPEAKRHRFTVIGGFESVATVRIEGKA